MKKRRVKRSDRETWVILENLKGVMRSLDAKGALILNFEKDGNVQFIWTSEDPVTKARIESVVKMLTDNGF